MAAWQMLGATCIAVLIAACTTALTPTPPAGTSEATPLRSAYETSTPCADLAARRLTETNPVQLALLGYVENACALPTDDISLSDAETALAGKSFALTAEGETLTLFQIAEGRKPSVCCSLQKADWRDLGDGRTYAARLHLKMLQSGMLKLTEKPLDQPLTDDDFIIWRGPEAPGELILKPDLDGTLSDHTLYSPELGETRKLIIYQPPQGGDGPLPTLYLADGDSLQFLARIIEPLIDAGEVSPILIVGMPSGQEGIVEDRSELGGDIRSLDYLPVDLPGMPPSRFATYLSYMADTLVPWVENEFGTAQVPRMRVVSGWSNGGGLSLNTGYRRPDVFGHAWPMSAGAGKLDTAVLPQGEAAMFRLSSGYYEPYFMSSTETSAQALTAAGYSVDTHWYAAGHMSDQWNHRLLENLKAVFPGPAARAD